MVRLSQNVHRGAVNAFLGGLKDMIDVLEDPEKRESHIVVNGKINGAEVLVLCYVVTGPSSTALLPIAVSVNVEMGLDLDDSQLNHVAQMNLSPEEAMLVLEGIQRGDHGEN